MPIDDNAKNHFERHYVTGDIELIKYCNGGVGCLKTGGETNKSSLFKGRLNNQKFDSNQNEKKN